MLYFCRIAPSLGELEADHTEVWGTFEYTSNDLNQPTCFFGLYDLRDYLALRRHRGKKWILWAGSDLENLRHGFIFNDGKLRLLSKIFRGIFRTWLIKVLRTADHYVEDEDEAMKLMAFGIESKIVPSFLGKIEDFPVHYHRPLDRPQVYISGHPGREDEYGFEIVRRVADRVRTCDFHIYGSMPSWNSHPVNITLHGKVPKEQFNSEIQNYHCGLRLNASDGFSEITAKSVLMGQYPITRLEYPLIPNFENEDELVSLLSSITEMRKPNHRARTYYLEALNKYPWVKRK